MANIPWQLLELLADGSSHSGEALGETLGVSRAAVWKMIQILQANGIDVQSVRGQGYSLSVPLDLLDARRISQLLSPSVATLLSQLDVERQIDSTNSALIGGNYPDRAVLLAEQQTAGRGRRGREWVSPLAANLYLSVRWDFSGGIASLEGLSLAVGVVLSEALEELGVRGVTLKWPNDLLINGKKLGGVLVEIGGDVTGDCFAVVGVGLNVAMPLQASDEIHQPWVDLDSVGYRAGRNVLAAQVIDHLIALLADYQTAGFRAYKTRWLERNALANKLVNVSGAMAVQGVVTGLNDSGALLLKTEHGEVAINGGEVSVRQAQAL